MSVVCQSFLKEPKAHASVSASQNDCDVWAHMPVFQTKNDCWHPCWALKEPLCNENTAFFERTRTYIQEGDLLRNYSAHAAIHVSLPLPYPSINMQIHTHVVSMHTHTRACAQTHKQLNSDHYSTGSPIPHEHLRPLKHSWMEYRGRQRINVCGACCRGT